MPRRTTTWIIALTLTLVTTACGDNHGVGPQQDAAAADRPEPQDAAGQVDAAPNACELEFRRCELEPADFCTKVGLECVMVRVDTEAKVCLRRCGGTEDCPFNSYCVPSKVEWGGLLLAAHHCFGSVCGETYGNGDLFGACNVGGDNLVSLDAGQQRPGTCVPIDTAAGTGACIESGNETTAATANRDESCSLDMVVAGCPPRREVLGCVTGTTCVGAPCDVYGTCALICDPRLDPESQCTIGAGSPKQYCQDSSLYTLGASGILHVGHFGVCQDLPRCQMFGPAEDGGAPAPGCLAGDGCYPTTMVTTNGVCAQGGSLAAGEACQYLNDCAPGTLCVGTEACGDGVCRALCQLPDGGNGCAPGLVCNGVSLDLNQPSVQSGTWGACVDQADKKARGRAPVLVRALNKRRR